jgi:hypothetical protein
MCLFTEELPNDSDRKIRYGWKVFFEQSNRLYSLFQDCGKARPINKWLTCAGSTPGWGVFKTRKDAMEYARENDNCTHVIRRVKIRGIRYKGAYRGACNFLGRPCSPFTLRGFTVHQILILPKQKRKTNDF